MVVILEMCRLMFPKAVGGWLKFAQDLVGSLVRGLPSGPPFGLVFGPEFGPDPNLRVQTKPQTKLRTKLGALPVTKKTFGPGTKKSLVRVHRDQTLFGL